MPDITTFNRLAEILGVDLNYFSDNFQSSVTGTSTSEPLENQSAELSTGRQKKNLVWDMSRMNLVDTDFSGLKNLHEKFSSSNMLNCQFIGSEMSGLILKNNKKMKQVEFIDCKADKITYAFLKNNLANLTGITLLSE